MQLAQVKLDDEEVYNKTKNNQLRNLIVTSLKLKLLKNLSKKMILMCVLPLRKINPGDKFHFFSIKNPTTMLFFEC